MEPLCKSWHYKHIVKKTKPNTLKKEKKEECLGKWGKDRHAVMKYLYFL